jgi:hypothetical protein
MAQGQVQKTVTYVGATTDEVTLKYTADSAQANAAGYQVVHSWWDTSQPRPTLVVTYAYGTAGETVGQGRAAERSMPPMPPHLLAEYQRILAGAMDASGRVHMSWHWETKQDLKDLKARLRLMKKELQHLKRTVRSEMKLLKTGFVAERRNAQEGSLASFSTLLGDKRAAGRDRASKRAELQDQQRATLAPYENLVGLIDDTVIQLERALVQLQAAS